MRDDQCDICGLIFRTRHYMMEHRMHCLYERRMHSEQLDYPRYVDKPFPTSPPAPTAAEIAATTQDLVDLLGELDQETTA